MPGGPTRSDLAAMQGGGFYNRHSAMQAAGIAALLPVWEAACRTVDISDGPVTIVDYGCSQGRNSMIPMRKAIDVLRFRAGAIIPIEVVHTDLPSNDFSSLFETLISDPNSYMTGTSDVFPLAIGKSYFAPLLSPGRVHLGWSTWALQWMSTNTIDAPDHILAGMSSSPAVAAAVAAQQARDWECFLTQRSREMRPGAKLVAGFTARAEADTGWEWLLGELWSAVGDMRKDGLLSEREEEQITIPIGLRSLEDIQAPFRQSGSFADLTLEHLDLVKVSDAFWPEFDGSGDRLAFARHHANGTRAWSGPLIASVAPHSRKQTVFVDELFSRFEHRLSKDPRPHEPYMATVVLSKKDR
ncbi:SAM-dependent methyltransferase [Rhizobium fabae]|uniref:SAM-dependent methyltransferase n=2 Tax=Rhizobium fabae TaxID=573179 RepID=A0ABY0BG24_9HYPH|nr:SAM-dependent methyltransferase [Rhizobium fabae]